MQEHALHPPTGRPRVLLGIGSGRCGTKSLAHVLSQQPGVRVTHEMEPLLPWQADRPVSVIRRRLNELRGGGRGCQLVGDVALFYLPYVEYALQSDAELRVVALRRPRHEVVASYRRWISRWYGPRVNHWTEPGGTWKNDPHWSPCYPKYDTADMNEGIERYWDEYYATIAALQHRFPGRVAVFEMRDALGTAAGQRALLDFAGVPRRQQVLCVGTRLNRNADRGSGDGVQVSVVVTCKGRLTHLRSTLPTMLGQVCPFAYEVIVVDYGCPEKTFAWCREINDRRLVAVRVDAAGSDDV